MFLCILILFHQIPTIHYHCDNLVCWSEKQHQNEQMSPSKDLCTAVIDCFIEPRCAEHQEIKMKSKAQTCKKLIIKKIKKLCSCLCYKAGCNQISSLKTWILSLARPCCCHVCFPLKCHISHIMQRRLGRRPREHGCDVCSSPCLSINNLVSVLECDTKTLYMPSLDTLEKLFFIH